MRRDPEGGRRIRPRLDSSSTPGTSSTPTTAEINLMIERYAGLGISGDRKIPVSDAVSQQYRVPVEITYLGHDTVKKYIDERILLIELHNKKIFEIFRKETIQLREATRGTGGAVRCPDSRENVASGHPVSHRTRTCNNCRV